MRKWKYQMEMMNRRLDSRLVDGRKENAFKRIEGKKRKIVSGREAI
jgi:hypothetical protein